MSAGAPPPAAVSATPPSAARSWLPRVLALAILAPALAGNLALTHDLTWPAVLTANSFPFWLAASYSPWFAPENYGQGLLYLALVLDVMAERKGWSIGAHVGLGLAFGATRLQRRSSSTATWI